MSFFVPTIAHRIFNIIIGLLFLCAGLILGSHLVMKSVEKEGMLHETLTRLNKLEQEVESTREIALRNNEDICKIRDAVSIHIVDIEDYLKGKKGHK